MSNNVKILRELAYEYSEIAFSERNFQKMKLHASVNDLKQIRPVVLIDELPWSEMNINNELTIRCENPQFRKLEEYLRKTIYKHKHMPADMVVPPYISVSKVIESTGIGISTKEETLATDENNSIVSHKYDDILKTDGDLEKIRKPVITYNEEKTMQAYNLTGEAIGDILPVRLTGIGYFASVTCDRIASFRGVANLLIDLADRPGFTHRLVRRLTDCKIAELEQYEALDLFDSMTYDLHCTPALTGDLPGKDFNRETVTRKNVWGRGTAQIFASVSPEMHDEFDIKYMTETIGQCGLVYYGCCEPLDNKIDIVEKIPNLRKISVTPWADTDVAAEAIGKRYVLSSKPNPAKVAVDKLDKDDLKKEITGILDACRRNSCNADIVLKDISSCNGRPGNIFEWEQIVMDLVEGY